jgi:hypothetical protein
MMMILRLMIPKVFALSALIAVFGSGAHSASFDCSKDLSKTEKFICDSRELSTLDQLMSEAWSKVKFQVGLSDQQAFLKQRDACGDEKCLFEKIGVRTGNLIAIADGMSDRVKQTPFQFIDTRDVLVRCRKNFQNTEEVQFAEILFSFELDGPTFIETNILKSGKHSESIWGWFVWNASASGRHFNSSKYSQNLLTRNYPVSSGYVNALNSGLLFSWNIYEDSDQGAIFTSFKFDPDSVKDCFQYLRELEM